MYLTIKATHAWLHQLGGGQHYFHIECYHFLQIFFEYFLFYINVNLLHLKQNTLFLKIEIVARYFLTHNIPLILLKKFIFQRIWVANYFLVFKLHLLKIFAIFLKIFLWLNLIVPNINKCWCVFSNIVFDNVELIQLKQVLFSDLLFLARCNLSFVLASFFRIMGFKLFGAKIFFIRIKMRLFQEVIKFGGAVIGPLIDLIVLRDFSKKWFFYLFDFVFRNKIILREQVNGRSATAEWTPSSVKALSFLMV